MNTKSRFLLKASIGFSLGILVGIIITGITATMSVGDGEIYIYNPIFAQRIGNIYASFLLELICYGLMGFVGMGFTALTYDNDRISILKATVIHFAAVMVTFFSVGFFLGWFMPTDIVANVIFSASFILAYVMIWVIQSAIYKKEIQSINNNLQKMKANEPSAG